MGLRVARKREGSSTYLSFAMMSSELTETRCRSRGVAAGIGPRREAYNSVAGCHRIVYPSGRKCKDFWCTHRYNQTVREFQSSVVLNVLLSVPRTGAMTFRRRSHSLGTFFAYGLLLIS